MSVPDNNKLRFSTLMNECSVFDDFGFPVKAFGLIKAKALTGKPKSSKELNYIFSVVSKKTIHFLIGSYVKKKSCGGDHSGFLIQLYIKKKRTL